MKKIKKGGSVVGDTWYQLLIGHRERSNFEKQRAFEVQAGMYLNFRAIWLAASR